MGWIVESDAVKQHEILGGGATSHLEASGPFTFTVYSRHQGYGFDDVVLAEQSRHHGQFAQFEMLGAKTDVGNALAGRLSRHHHLLERLFMFHKSNGVGWLSNGGG